MVRELTNAFIIPDKSTFTFCFLRDDFILQYWFKLCLTVFVREHTMKKEIFPFPKYPKKKKGDFLDK